MKDFNIRNFLTYTRRFDLARLELEIGFTILKDAGQGVGTVWQPGRLFHVLRSAPYNQSFFFDVSSALVQEVRTIHDQFRSYDNPRLDVRGLATQLGGLKEFPHESPLRFLGYFAILESLLTHPPKPTDPYDSITRQVKKKLALLNNRWTPKIDYSPFGDAKAERIWSTMYGYRSRLAHGGSASISGDLVLLRDHGTALGLLKNVVKALLRHALSEPQLLLDLKDC